MALPIRPQALRGRSDRVAAVLDVGTSKVAAAVALIDNDSPPRVLGAASRACAGLRRGLVADMQRTEAAIRGAMADAEGLANVEVSSVFVSLSAGGVGGEAFQLETDIAGHRIEDADLDRLLGEARARLAGQRKGRTLLHALPTLYTVDGLDGVTNPRGFHANKLSVDIHAVSAETPPCRNLDLVVRAAHLGADAIVASGLAAGLAVLSDEERELGVACIEMGAGVTTVAVHAGGMLLGLQVVAMGSADVTADIAGAFGCKRSVAERLKIVRGAATTSPRDNHEMIDVAGLGDEEGTDARRVTRAELIAVVRGRLELWLAQVERALEALGFAGAGARQVVLTGGGAELTGIADWAAKALGRNVRVGRPRGVAGLGPLASGGGATLAGLVLYAANGSQDLVRGGPAVPESGREQKNDGRIGRLMGYLRKQI
jgi:cell division protein FtsA